MVANGCEHGGDFEHASCMLRAIAAWSRRISLVAFGALEVSMPADCFNAGFC